MVVSYCGFGCVLGARAGGGAEARRPAVLSKVQCNFGGRILRGDCLRCVFWGVNLKSQDFCGVILRREHFIAVWGDFGVMWLRREFRVWRAVISRETVFAA